MDSLIIAAARALAAGDPLGALKRVALRDDAPALALRGLAMAHKKYGKLPWIAVVMPAVELAERGFSLSDGLARSLNREVGGQMARYPASVAAYGKPGGAQWQSGDMLVLKDLGRSLRAIATKGPDVFYTGWIADSIAASMAAGGGLISKADLAQYRPRLRAPVRGTFK